MKTDTDAMRAAAINLNLSWSSKQQIEAANEIDKLRDENWKLRQPRNCKAVSKSKGGKMKKSDIRLEMEIKRLRDGILECLLTNRHLADGEDCTLIDLKRLVPEWESEFLANGSGSTAGGDWAVAADGCPPDGESM